ncbi:hypothetical protein LMG26857_03267 [Achromobacter anxifer]|uniref:ATP-binding cassette domain-containing protein n=1 Tax=Achromobacter anxifer TaxID=1287737 RepID=UPI00155C2044|nr:ABC transporter ATP-binding protein [Achromobacter anxifer]CAB5514228.1 hypothetical protein LMG26857_03267 [Achromobacter anxifer]
MPEKTHEPTENFSFEDQLRAAAAHRAFGPEGPFQIDLSRLSDGASLHLVLGDNGSGKSFLVQRLAKVAHAAGCSPMQLSMGYRARSGVERQLMYGDEATQSTGLASLGVMRRAFRSMQGWGSNPHVALLDEPDIGLSDRFAYPMGQRIAMFAMTRPAGTKGVLVVTHSRALVRGVLSELPSGESEPSVILLGSRYKSLANFLEEPAYATLDELEQLEEQNITIRARVRTGAPS